MNETSTQRPQLLLSFSGIDGAGKSTQISRLRHALQHTGLSVELVTFWDDVATLSFLREEIGHKVFKGDKGVGSPQAPIRRRDKNIKSTFLTLFRMAIYALDAVSLRLVARRLRRQPPGTRADVIIFDRFLYDELANLNLAGVLTRLYVRVLLRLIPKPRLAFVLDADPDAAFARKPEYPLEFLHSNRKSYLRLAKMAGMTVIAPSSIDQAHRQILALVEQARPALPPQAGAPVDASDQNTFVPKGHQMPMEELPSTVR